MTFDTLSLEAKVEEITVSILLSLAWLTVISRFYVRYRFSIRIGWDDYFMLLTLIVFSLYCSFMIVIINRGGFQATNVQSTLSRTVVYVVLAEVCYILATTLLKYALALYFLRILDRKWEKWTIYVALSIATFAGTLYMFLAIFQCGNPVDLAQNVLIQNCVPHSVNIGVGYFFSTVNVLADWTFVILPIFKLRGLQMDRRSKVSLIGIIGIGAVGSISSIVRMFYIEGSVFGPNFFANAAELAVWSTIEPGVGIIAGSLITLRPLLKAAMSYSRRAISSHTNTFTRPDTRHYSQTGSESKDKSVIRARSRSRSRAHSKSNVRQREYDVELQADPKPFANEPSIVTTIVGGKAAQQRQPPSHQQQHSRNISRARVTPPSYTSEDRTWLNIDPEDEILADSTDDGANQARLYPSHNAVQYFDDNGDPRVAPVPNRNRSDSSATGHNTWAEMSVAQNAIQKEVTIEVRSESNRSYEEYGSGNAIPKYDRYGQRIA